jgi:hypothetical protein
MFNISKWKNQRLKMKSKLVVQKTLEKTRFWNFVLQYFLKPDKVRCETKLAEKLENKVKNNLEKTKQLTSKNT